MSVKIIQERLDQANCQSPQDEQTVLKEIMQEVALAALSRTDFFKKASLQGGTSLRVLYTLERFSEDLDFILRKPEPDFSFNAYIKALSEEFNTYGIPMEVIDRTKVGEPVKKLFLKQDSEGVLLVLKQESRTGRPKKIRIKLEIDTNPPSGSRSETKYLDFPFNFSLSAQDLPSLFAGKSHALLCRGYVKGRDWYDFLWFVARKTPINFEFLGNACEQQGPWQGRRLDWSKKWYLEEMNKKIKSINWDDAKKDVERFLKPRDSETLNLWNSGFFLNRLQKLEEYL